ncbi:hypothetical protein [Mycolicibacterium agri]|nr:hypothetical protein [Mycolicibacterium agri]GFG53271.1 hypothetical protein MAGR_47120 [Mycolicibacterium agri]
MDNTTVVWIVVAIAALIVIAALIFAARNARNKRRHAEAQRIREDVNAHSSKLEKRQAIADETAARARAAEAEAEAKAAEAARLKEQASDHHDAVSTTREEIEERRRHADRIDPKTKVKGDRVDNPDTPGHQKGAADSHGMTDPHIVTDRDAAQRQGDTRPQPDVRKVR